MKIEFAIVLLASMVAMSHGLTIDCQYSTMSFGNNPNQAYTCQATITINGNPDTITAVTGSHLQGMTNANVGGFYLMNSYMMKLDKLPSNLATFFPHLIQLNWDNSRLKALTPADLQPFPNLISVSFQMNMLRVIDGDLFKNNKYIRYINLAYNSIEVIGSDFLDGLDYLVDVQFYGNRCVQMMMMMQIGMSYSLADFKEDLLYMCGPDNSSPTEGSCPANCSSSAAALESQVSAIQEGFSKPWYVRMMKVLQIWFNF